MYPGGKSNHVQKIINLIPPHRVYIETHLGGGAIARAKRPAARNILIDKDAAAIAAFNEAISPSSIVINGVGGPGEHLAAFDNTARFDAAAAASNLAMLAASPTKNGDTVRNTYELICVDAVPWLRSYPFQGDEFVYCDPPYMMSTRSSQRRIYRYELSDTDHADLLACLLTLPCKVMISGYWSDLYADALAGWHTVNFQAVTRSGKMATEWLWMNYPTPVRLHEYTYLGDNFRERERIKRKKGRWVERLKRMDLLERQALLAALNAAGFD